ncbi:hypothetical protein MRB53_037489 [Persea americana]|nr:hypothetical protein MRB53_037489 [Persea americana]
MMRTRLAAAKVSRRAHPPNRAWPATARLTRRPTRTAAPSVAPSASSSTTKSRRPTTPRRRCQTRTSLRPLPASRARRAKSTASATTHTPTVRTSRFVQPNTEIISIQRQIHGDSESDEEIRLRMLARRVSRSPSGQAKKQRAVSYTTSTTTSTSTTEWSAGGVDVFDEAAATAGASATDRPAMNKTPRAEARLIRRRRNRSISRSSARRGEEDSRRLRVRRPDRRRTALRLWRASRSGGDDCLVAFDLLKTSAARSQSKSAKGEDMCRGRKTVSLQGTKIAQHCRALR